MSVMRYKEKGWIKIGITCTAGRRSLWVRFPRNENYFELCAGREGDDDYVRVDESNPCYHELREVMESAVFAAET